MDHGVRMAATWRCSKQHWTDVVGRYCRRCRLKPSLSTSCLCHGADAMSMLAGIGRRSVSALAEIACLAERNGLLQFHLPSLRGPNQKGRETCSDLGR